MNVTLPLSRLAALALAACATSPPASAPDDRDGRASVPLAMRVDAVPAPFDLGGAAHLVWELTLENRTAEPVTVESVEVTSGAESRLRYAADALHERWRLFPAGASREDGAGLAKGVIPPGDSALVYLWLSAEDAGQLPAQLGHRVTVGSPERTLELPPIEVLDAGTVAVLGPPVVGEGWFVVNAPSDTSRHRRSVQRIDRGRYMAQRYAVDLVRVLSESGTFVGDPLDNASYSAYGAELLAVADGVVVAAKDGVPDNVPGKDSRAVEMTLETLAGNYVVLDIGDARYVTYAHLKPGSLRVAEGTRVSRGEVLALLGNSGNSTEPHLHLHVCDAPSALRCQGRPWVLERFVEQEVKLPTNGQGPPTVTDPVVRQRSIPVNMGYLTLP